MQSTAYVGLDVHKATISVSFAEDGRDGDVRFIGTIPNTPTDVLKLVKRLAKKIKSWNSATRPEAVAMASIARLLSWDMVAQSWPRR